MRVEVVKNEDGIYGLGFESAVKESKTSDTLANFKRSDLIAMLACTFVFCKNELEIELWNM